MSYQLIKIIFSFSYHKYTNINSYLKILYLIIYHYNWNMEKDFSTILTESKKGNSYHLGLLYNDFYHCVNNVVLGYINDIDDAKDFTQDIFIKAFDKIKMFQNDCPKHFYSWLKKLATFYMIDYTRKTKMNFVKDYQCENISDVYEEVNFIDQFTDDEIHGAIKKLPEQQSVAINLYYFEKLSHAEIAKKLNIQEGTSKSNLCKGRRKLYTILNN